MENEIMENEVVVEITEGIESAAHGKNNKFATGIALGILVGLAAYRYVIKPVAAKLLARNEKPPVIADVEIISPDGETAISTEE